MQGIIDKARNMEICIVEPDLAQSKLLKSRLGDAAFEHIHVTVSMSSLLALMRKQVANMANPICNSFDLILLSDNVEDTNVFEACRLLSGQAEISDVAVAVLSRAEDEELERVSQTCLDAGAMDVIPFFARPDEFISRILLCLNLQKERCLRRIREEAWETELAERKVMEARLKHLVAHDDLTGLANRRRLEQALELAVIRARNFHRTNALLYIDLDQFKVVNDAEGHDVGDRMLLDVANRLRGFVKPDQLIARIGSDEFAILLEHVTDAQALEFADRLRKMLGDATFTCGSVTYHMSASLGVVLNKPDEEVSVSNLLARADQACHVAKTQGRNTVYIFSNEDAGLRELRSDAQWVPLIRRALSDDRFFLVFQPIMHLINNRVSHYEVLIRMHGENGEVYTPNDFIPAAERMGLIHQIDLWVVEHSLDFLASLPSSQANVSVSINLSGHAFQDRTLLPLIKQKLDMTWVSASRITFEITETAAITNFSETRDMVARLRALGCRFALDDFGSGFCSFSYIKNYPVDMLKIDGSFITNLINDETDQLLVKSMIDVAHSLGKKVIAEYVENQKVLDKLIEMGADYGQGFYIGKPDTALVEGNIQLQTTALPGLHKDGSVLS